MCKWLKTNKKNKDKKIHKNIKCRNNLKCLKKMEKYDNAIKVDLLIG
jgi:hypothetical protein